MYRIVNQELIKWKSKKNRKPLIVSGSRQIGKTYSIKDFGSKNFKYLCEINFEKRPDLHKIFELNLDVNRIIVELEIVLSLPIQNGETLLFFDEIQTCSNALKSLRYFYEEAHHIPIIAAGSLLDFEFREISFPVGRVDFLNMYALNFEEFLLAIGQEKILKLIKEDKHISPFVEDKIYQFLDDYFFTGGMPEIVKEYIETNDLKAIRELQLDLMLGFENDFSKYNTKVDKGLLREIVRNTASTIGRQIIYTKLSSDFTQPTIKKGVEVLTTAKIFNKIKNVSLAGLPLVAVSKQFKLILNDIGLLSMLSGVSPIDKVSKVHFQGQFNGYMAEQFVGQQLLFKHHVLNYWGRTASGASAEVDYIIIENSKIVPIEVKSGHKGALKSLQYLLSTHENIEKAIVYSKTFSGSEGKIEFRPIYKAGFDIEE